MVACRIDLGSQPLNSLKASKQAHQAAKGEGKKALLPSKTSREKQWTGNKFRTRKHHRLLLRGERGECVPTLDPTLLALDLTSHGSPWEAGKPDCWSGGIISFHMSLPGKDEEPASLPRNGWIWGKHLEHSTSVLMRHRERMPHDPQSDLNRGSSEVPERRDSFYGMIVEHLCFT